MFTTNQQVGDILTKGSSTRGKWDELIILFGIVPEPFQHPHFSRCLFPPAQAMAQRSHQSIDDVQKFYGASSKFKASLQKRVLALAALRRENKKTTLISKVDAKTRDNMLRRHLDATSPRVTMPQASGDFIAMKRR